MGLLAVLRFLRTILLAMYMCVCKVMAPCTMVLQLWTCRGAGPVANGSQACSQAWGSVRQQLGAAVLRRSTCVH
jgi:hypothetical protein